MTYEDYRAADIESELTPDRVRSIRVLHAAMPAGVLLFLLVTVVMVMRRPADAAGGDAPLALLSLINAALALICWAGAIWWFDAGFRKGGLGDKARLSAEINGASSGSPAVSLLRAALVTRLAIMEAAALFGLVDIIIGVTGGQLQGQPLFWLNALPAVAMIAFAVVNFPTRDGLIRLYRSRFR